MHTTEYQVVSMKISKHKLKLLTLLGGVRRLNVGANRAH